jgi:hypothetical protein
MNKVKFEKFLDKFEFRKYADIVSNGKNAFKTGMLMGESGIPLCCAEEIAFRKKLNPLWNSIKT